MNEEKIGVANNKLMTSSPWSILLKEKARSLLWILSNEKNLGFVCHKHKFL